MQDLDNLFLQVSNNPDPLTIGVGVVGAFLVSFTTLLVLMKQFENQKLEL